MNPVLREGPLKDLPSIRKDHLRNTGHRGPEFALGVFRLMSGINRFRIPSLLRKNGPEKKPFLVIQDGNFPCFVIVDKFEIYPSTLWGKPAIPQETAESSLLKLF